ncbi:MAG: hypothetical protein GEU81_17675 [Nitriliruptorales bacterium]|nr:hypothetical protein [Nitriliruptorales bacterium]
MDTRIIDPIGIEPAASGHVFAPRPPRIEGLSLGLLDNGKPNAAHVIATAAAGLRAHHRAGEATAVTKAVASRACPDAVLTRFKGFDAAIVGVGD